MIPKISIIVPCYGVEDYLGRCLESLVTQSLREIEIILVDDKSPDKVPIMCDEWAKKDGRIKVIHKEVNEGLGYARNTGLLYATGEFVAFVDSDDFVDKNMFLILYNKAKERKADTVFCNCIFYKDEKHMKTRYDVTSEKCFCGRKDVDTLLFDFVGPAPSYKHDAKYMISVWHSIYQREIIESNNIRFVSERDIISEDMIFDIDYLNKAQHVVYIPDALYYYCDNSSSLSRKVDMTRYERLKLFLIVVKDKLESYYSESEYRIHYDRQLFICLRIAIKFVYKTPEMGLLVSDVVKDLFWQDMLNTYPYTKMDCKHKVFFWLIKNKIIWPIKVLFKIS